MCVWAKIFVRNSYNEQTTILKGVRGQTLSHKRDSRGITAEPLLKWCIVWSVSPIFIPFVCILVTYREVSRRSSRAMCGNIPNPIIGTICVKGNQIMSMKRNAFVVYVVYVVYVVFFCLFFSPHTCMQYCKNTCARIRIFSKQVYDLPSKSVICFFREHVNRFQVLISKRVILLSAQMRVKCSQADDVQCEARK